MKKSGEHLPLAYPYLLGACHPSLVVGPSFLGGALVGDNPYLLEAYLLGLEQLFQLPEEEGLIAPLLRNKAPCCTCSSKHRRR